jgi:hypothetical protein
MQRLKDIGFVIWWSVFALCMVALTLGSLMSPNSEGEEDPAGDDRGTCSARFCQ